MPGLEDLLSDEDEPIIEDLLPETIEGVAARILVSNTFEERVYRECELDALWTLADIAISVEAHRETGHVPAAWQQLPEGSGETLVRLRSLLEQAHELAVDGGTTEAAAILHAAALLCASWS